jgi:hypothetical protein
MPCAARPGHRASAPSCTPTTRRRSSRASKAAAVRFEHGAYADDAAFKAMKDANVFFDPNIGLVLQNYIENKAKYMGSGNYNEEGFAFMEKAVPTLAVGFKRALSFGLRMPWEPMRSPARTGRTRVSRLHA